MSVLPDKSPADAAPGEQNSPDALQFPWILFFAFLVSVGMTTRTLDVLLVEDRSIDAQVTLSALRQAATPNARVLRLRAGDEALRYLFAVGEFARRSPALPGLVLLDTEMPMVSGHCVLDVIRAHPATSGMRVVMLTADTRPRFAEQDGFSPDGYLMKSQDFDQYCAAMELTLKRWLPRILKEHHQRAWPAVQRLTLRSV
jgi:CheY-like chemotaxis protein